jgi:hypothetical protein
MVRRSPGRSTPTVGAPGSEEIAPPGVAAGQRYPEQMMGALDG